MKGMWETKDERNSAEERWVRREVYLLIIFDYTYMLCSHWGWFSGSTNRIPHFLLSFFLLLSCSFFYFSTLKSHPLPPCSYNVTHLGRSGSLSLFSYPLCLFSSYGIWPHYIYSSPKPSVWKHGSNKNKSKSKNQTKKINQKALTHCLSTSKTATRRFNNISHEVCVLLLLVRVYRR